MEGRCLEYNDGMASRNLARFLCVLPCLTDLTITDSQESPSWLSEDFYQEIALRGPSSMNNFFNKKLHMDESSEKLRQMDLRQQSEYIGHLLHPTSSEKTPCPTSRAPEPLSSHQGSVEEQIEHPLVTPSDLDVPSSSGINAQSDKIPEVPADIQEAITEGEAPWNRSRIMVIGPAGVGKTSLIRRLTDQNFNPDEKSTKGAEQNVVTKSAVSSWIIIKDAQSGNGTPVDNF
ncbi:uncharacterized protein LOC105436753 [Strongylocentrotus purpuratus]|uniref:Uncharacterized protein n=1 Tax=Strongylocentrotus purpuratus TaxID=7668 RepID=A0A7M7PG74_STRPU|nr:uncharacterized protein LOC105436753 [Strongylocentrotus purpuratus]